MKALPSPRKGSPSDTVGTVPTPQQWTTMRKVVARHLQTEANLTTEKMPVVLALSQLLWTGSYDVESVPSTQQIAEWSTLLDRWDRKMFTDQADDIDTLHLFVDGSKSGCDRRYVLLCSFWDRKRCKPTVHTLAAFRLVADTADAFAKEIESVLETADIWEGKIGCLMCDFAATNWGRVLGLAKALSGALDVPVTPAGCDLHLQNRALATAVEAAFGTYKVGDVHIISMAYRLADLLDSDWPSYKALMQAEITRLDANSDQVTHCPMPVVTRWWTVILAAIWIDKHLSVLLYLADWIYKYFPSKQSDLRQKWRELHIWLSNKYLQAQLQVLVTFGNVHYLAEMAWSEEINTDHGVAGFKAQYMPARLVARTASLQLLVRTYRNVFCDAIDTCPLALRNRLATEIRGFLDTYLETTKRLGSSWLEPPLVFVALGDTGHCRQIALGMMAAESGGSNNEPLTAAITKNSVEHHCLMTTSLHQCVEAMAHGALLLDPQCAGLLKWVQSNAWGAPHANAFSESAFNLMDRLAWTGGPAMGAATTERRVMHLQNHVLSQRSHSPNAKGKTKKWHPTRAHLRQGLAALKQAAGLYPECLDKRAVAPPPIDRTAPDFLGHIQRNAAGAQPDRRKQYNAAQEAAALVVPLKGKVHSANL